jgi:type 1 glutamine amidotransferase
MKLQDKLTAMLIPAAVALALLSVSTGALCAADQPKQRKSALVMLGNVDTWHIGTEQIDAVAGLLTGYCNLAANFSDNPADFTFENARKYDVIILYAALSPDAQNQQHTKEALQNIFRAVEAGTPLLAIHGGIHNATVYGGTEINEKIGSTYVNAAHFPYQRFNIKVAKGHPITAGVSDFRVSDEPYLIEMSARDAQILASYDARVVSISSPFRPGLAGASRDSLLLNHKWAEKTAESPLMYARTLGKGRIVMNALGHDGEALRSPVYRTLTQQSLDWLFGGR